MVNTAFTFESGDLQRYHNQAGFHITTGHIAHAVLEMHVPLSPDFLAFTIWLITRKWMLCWSLVHLKRKGNFKWIEIVIPSLVLSFFSIKNQWHCHKDFLVYRSWMSVDTDHRWRIYTIRTVSCLFILSSSASVTLWNHFPHWWQQIMKLPSDWQLVQNNPLNPLRTENLLQQVPRCDLLCWLDKDWAHFLFCHIKEAKHKEGCDWDDPVLFSRLVLNNCTLQNFLSKVSPSNSLQERKTTNFYYQWKLWPLYPLCSLMVVHHIWHTGNPLDVLSLKSCFHVYWNLLIYWDLCEIYNSYDRLLQW